MRVSDINAALAEDPLWIPDPDPDHPLEIHESHHVVDGACLRCGALDHWPLVTKACPTRKTKRDAWSLEQASDALRHEWRRFSEWWADREHPAALPDLASWFAEWFEWRRHEGTARHADIRRAALREALAACERGRDAGRDAIAVLKEMLG